MELLKPFPQSQPNPRSHGNAAFPPNLLATSIDRDCCVDNRFASNRVIPASESIQSALKR
ncbi:unnamed protein product [Closterium sp. Yama58-4]|nr:unnamed protein product [Closterium sp. Yama58-4]